MKHKHISKLALLAALWLFSCTEVGKRDNPDDPDGINYVGDWPSSSSSSAPSSSSVAQSSSSIAIVSGTFTDSRDSNTYKWAEIGSQTWMAENLNYNATGSKCYNNNEFNCVTYGRLYNWVTATALPDSCNLSSCASQISPKHRGICPEGWHIPSNAEWDTLITAVGGAKTAGRYLKATSGWNDGGNGEDKYGFSALPGGYYNSFNWVGPQSSIGDAYNTYSESLGSLGFWWSSTFTERSFNYAYYKFLIYNSKSIINGNPDCDNRNLLSIRCVKD